MLLWASAFVWVYEPINRDRMIPGLRAVPFIPWEVQEEALIEIHECIRDGEDGLMDKSRDMGASWCNLIVIMWWWLFVEQCPFMLASRTEDLVDRKGDPDCLMWKCDYLLDHLPPWMKPNVRQGIERTHLHLLNPDNGSVIDGSSTNSDLGRGGRRRAALLDEFAAVDQAEPIYRSTSDVTPCRLFNSTPKGAGHIDGSGTLRGNCFAAIRFSGKVKIVSMPWWRHPVKGLNAKQVVDPISGKLKWTSPWYRRECERRVSSRDIAENLDMDYVASGDMFFDSDVLSRIRASTDLCEPLHRGEMGFHVETLEEGQSYRVKLTGWKEGAGRARVALWLDLIAGLPPRDRNYVMFADIGLGTGASNSTLRVVTTEREEVAEFTCAFTSPESFARYCVAMAKWFAGARGFGFLGWEANGPGEIFGKEVWRCGYRYVLGNYDTRIPWEPEDNKIGIYTNRDSKHLLLGGLRSALARREYVTHDEKLIAECEQYIYYAGGGVGPSSLTEEPQGARAAHGDRVVAAMGIPVCLNEVPKVRLPEPEPDDNSMEAARRRAKAKREALEKPATW